MKILLLISIGIIIYYTIYSYIQEILDSRKDLNRG